MKNLILIACALLAGLILADHVYGQYPAYYGTPGYVMPYGSTGTYYRGYDSRVGGYGVRPGTYYGGGRYPWGYGGNGYSYDYSYYSYHYSPPRTVTTTTWVEHPGLQAYRYMNANGQWCWDGYQWVWVP